MKIGVITDCFQKTHFEGIEIAGKLGLQGVQIYATTGEFSPETLTESKKAEYKDLLKKIHNYRYYENILTIMCLKSIVLAVLLNFFSLIYTSPVLKLIVHSLFFYYHFFVLLK